MSAGIYIDIDGSPVDLDKVSWYSKAPCGCVDGCTIGFSDYHRPALVVATEEQAIERFWESKQERDKYIGLGFTVFADLRSKVTEYLSGDCPHEPRYGIPKLPEVDGYAWAAANSYDSRSPLMHLVPDVAIENAAERRFGSERMGPLCKGRPQFWWSTEEHVLWDKVECKRCVAAARKLVTA